MGGASLELRDVAFHYPGSTSPALEDIQLTVRAGETIVLLGPSGCGKSTLLRIINRLLIPQRGMVIFDGRDTAGLDVVTMRRQMGYVIQQAGLFPHFTVGENIATVPRLLGWNRQRVADRVREMLQLVRLDPALYEHRKPRMLSGGEAQRVGVARALAAQPALLLMDEPFGALDPLVRGELQAELMALIASFGTTTMLVTHDVSEALRLAGRVVVMQGGRIEQVADPINVLRHPLTPYVANFVGSKNLFRQLELMPLAALRLRAAEQEPPQTFLRIARSATLYDALLLLLAAPQQAILAVDDDGHITGTLEFADIVRALAQAEFFP